MPYFFNSSQIIPSRNSSCERCGASALLFWIPLVSCPRMLLAPPPSDFRLHPLPVSLSTHEFNLCHIPNLPPPCPSIPNKTCFLLLLVLFLSHAPSSPLPCHQPHTVPATIAVILTPHFVLNSRWFVDLVSVMMAMSAGPQT